MLTAKIVLIFCLSSLRPDVMSVKVMRPKLNQDDIVRLMKGSSVEDRAQATHKLCRRIGNEELNESG